MAAANAVFENALGDEMARVYSESFISSDEFLDLFLLAFLYLFVYWGICKWGDMRGPGPGHLRSWYVTHSALLYVD